MTKKGKRAISVVSSASLMMTMIPSSMFSSLAAEPISVAMPQSFECTFGDTDLSYKYDGENIFSNSEDLGYTISVEEYKPGTGSGNETGLLPFNSKVSVDDDGVITGFGVGVFHLTAHLKDGYVWSNANLGMENEDVKVEFTVNTLLLPFPELAQDVFDYSVDGTYDIKTTEESEYWILDTENSEINVKDPGTYKLYYELADTMNTRWAEPTASGSYTGAYELSYTVKECEHVDSDGKSTYVNGICSICHKGFEKPVLNDNGTDDVKDDFYEISNAGQLIWYMSNTEDTVKNAVLCDDIVIPRDTLSNGMPRSKYNNGTFDGQGHVISGLKYDERIFAGNTGTIKNLGIDGDEQFLIVYANAGKIENCYALGKTRLCDTNYNGAVIQKSYADATAGASLCYNAQPYSTITDCAVIGSGKGVSSSYNATVNVTNYSADDAASGKMAHDLGEAWHQNIEVGEPDSYPVLSEEHGTVYCYTDCQGNEVYTNFENKYPAENGGYHVVGNESGGYCTVCGEAVIEEPEVIDGVYQVENLAELIYALNADPAEGTDTTQIALVNDIDCCGREWNQIESFSGTIYGQGHVISNVVSDSGAMFGTLTDTAVISDLVIAESNITGGTGALCEENNGTVRDCISVMEMPLAGSGNTENCYYISDEPTDDGGRTAEQFRSGEVAYEMNENSASVWGQKIGTDEYPVYGTDYSILKFNVGLDFDSDIEYDDTAYVNENIDQMSAQMAALYDDILSKLSEEDSYGYYYDYGFKLSIEDEFYFTIIRKPNDIEISGNTEYSFKYMSEITPIDLTELVSNPDSVGDVTVSCDGILPKSLKFSDDGKSIVGTVITKAGSTLTRKFIFTAENGSTKEVWLTFTVLKGDAPEITVPENIEVKHGEKLSETELPDGWTWADGDTVADVSVTEYDICMDIDCDNYDYSSVEGADAATGKLTRTIEVSVVSDSIIMDSVGAKLSGGIGFTYLFYPTKAMLDDADSYIMVNDTKYLLSELTAESDGSYKLTHWINAKEMTDDLVFVPYSGDDAALGMIKKATGEEVDAVSCTVAEYLSKLDGEAEKLLAEAMLNYGTYSQLHFEYNTDKAVYTNETALATVSADDVSSYKAVVDGTVPEGMKLSGMSLVLRSNTVARLVFYTEDLSAYTFELDGNSVSAHELNEENWYCIEVENIHANDLSETHTVTINGCSFTISALSYVSSVLENSEDEALINAAKSIYLYYKAAMDYVKQ